jgi:hypothetical protein
MKTAITISKDQLIIDGNCYNAGTCVALGEHNLVVIVHSSNARDRLFESLFNKVILNGAAYESASAFCVAFNALAAGAAKQNTDYTDTPFSSLLTPAIETNICNQVKKGYAILSAPDTNTGVINYGPTGLGVNSAGLAPGQSVVIESGNLSKWFVKNQTAADKVNVAGEYKS